MIMSPTDIETPSSCLDEISSQTKVFSRSKTGAGADESSNESPTLRKTKSLKRNTNMLFNKHAMNKKGE
jgi:hypothetical protein